MNENQFTEKVKKALRTIPGVCFEKRHGSVYGKAGQPDISGCVDGRRFEIELKVDDNTPTELQVQRLNEWHAAGAATAVLWPDDEWSQKTAERWFKQQHARQYHGDAKTAALAFKGQVLNGVSLAPFEGLAWFIEWVRGEERRA